MDDVVFAYSDVTHEYVMHKGSEALAAGANFILLGPDATMLEATDPDGGGHRGADRRRQVQTTRAVAATLKEAGKKVVAVRHPMPYGDLVAQRVQRFGELEDLDRYDCTIEEREEYEPHIKTGTVIYAGVDYADDPRAGAGRSATCCCGTAGTTTSRSTGRRCSIVARRSAAGGSRDQVPPRGDQPPRWPTSS